MFIIKDGRSLARPPSVMTVCRRVIRRPFLLNGVDLHSQFIVDRTARLLFPVQRTIVLGFLRAHGATARSREAGPLARALRLLGAFNAIKDFLKLNFHNGDRVSAL